jgi:hypothetical protein
MSASTLSRRACTAIFCAAFAFFPNVPAFAQSLSYMPVDRFGTLLPEVMQPPGQQSETPFLYLTLGSGKAIRYGIGVGRAGFTWSGIETSVVPPYFSSFRRNRTRSRAVSPR